GRGRCSLPARPRRPRSPMELCMRASSLCLFGLLAATPAWSAINPAEYQRIGSDHLLLHEQARIVDETVVEGHHWRRVTHGGRLGNVNRHAGSVVFPDHYQSTGAVYVPTGAQYSFDPPY